MTSTAFPPAIAGFGSGTRTDQLSRTVLSRRTTLHASPLSKRPTAVSRVFAPKFGASALLKGKNVIWLTPEFFHPSLSNKTKAGGLGQVGVTMWPLQKEIGFNGFQMFPFFEAFQDAGFQNTGLDPLVLPNVRGKQEKFELMWKDIDGVICLAIKNDEFGKRNNLYSGDEHAHMAKFAIASAHFLSQLNKLKNQSGSEPWMMKGGPDVAFMNDTWCGPLLKEMETRDPELLDRLATPRYLHNHFDKSFSWENARDLGLSIVNFVKKSFSMGLADAASHYSSLGSLLDGPDGRDDLVIVDPHYARDMLSVDALGVGNAKAHLAEAMEKGLTRDMWHFPSQEYDPATTPALDKAKGYRHLESSPAPNPLNTLLASAGRSLIQRRPMLLTGPALQRELDIRELRRFKRANKMALQRELGLPVNKNAKVYGWLSRSDGWQKGAYMMTDNVAAFLRKHPDAQMVIGGGLNDKHPDPRLRQFAKDIAQLPDIRNRVRFFDKFVDQTMSQRLLAGSDFLIHCSNYEPFGLSPQEARKYGCVPIMAPWSGMWTSGYDPAVSSPYPAKLEEAHRRSYGQTAIFMDPYDLNAYLTTLKDEWTLGNPWTPETPAIQDADQKLLNALERGYKMAQSGTLMDVAKNGMDYVNDIHSEKKVTEMYQNILEDALRIRDARVATKYGEG